MSISKNLLNKGFTLVELLVVIAIIAILFAVVLIAINPAQRFKDSRNARRLSDVGSIVGAATTYVVDRRGSQLPDVPDYQCIGSKPAAVIIDPGPQAHWKFENNTNDAAGAAGGPFNGTTSEATYPAAKLGQGLTLQNPLYGVNIANTIGNPTNALTVEGWIKLNQKIEPGSFDHNQAIFDKGNYRLQLNSDTGKFEFETQNGSAWSMDYNTSLTTVKGINAFTQFQEVLYAGGIDVSNQAVLLKKIGGTWSAVSNYPTGQQSINALAVYDGKLYSGQIGGRVYEFDGTTWQSTNLETLTGTADALSLATYRGKLYAGLGSLIGASVWVYDGVSWSNANFSLLNTIPINWTFQTSATNNQWSSIAYGNGLFVAVANSGTGNRVMTSPDGINWTSQTSAADYTWYSVTYGNGLFVAVAYSGTGNRVMTSPDGITWTMRTSAADNNSWLSVTYGNGLFVAVACGVGAAGCDTAVGNRVMTSPNGIDWTIRASTMNNPWSSIAYGNGLFVAVANSGTGNRVMTSPESNTIALAVYALSVFNGKLYAGTGKGPANQDARLFEFDGNSWTQKLSPSDFSGPPYKDAAYSLEVYDRELFIGLGGSGAASGEVRKWTGIGPPTQVGTINEQMVLSLGVMNGMLMAGTGGAAGDGDIYSWSGAAWNSVLDNASAAEIRALHSYGGKSYAGGRGANSAQSGIWAYGNNDFIESRRSTWYPNVWYHIAGVYDGTNSQMKILINGAVDATQTSGAPGIVAANTQPLYLGVSYGSDAFSGVIDDFAVHHSVLSDTDIASHAGCYNLGPYLVSEYMGALPIDPSSSVTDGTDTGYFISKDTSGVVTITAPLTEITSSIPELIKASR